MRLSRSDIRRAVLRQIHAAGVAILLVEQFVHRALSIADRVYVLEKGRVVETGSAEEFRGDAQRLASSYLGGTVEEPAPTSTPAKRRRTATVKTASRDA